MNSPDDFERIPALPNLDYKLRVGESLVSALGKGGRTKNQLVNLDTRLSSTATADAFFLNNIKELRELKNLYFDLEERKKHDPGLAKATKADLRKQITQKEKEFARDLGFDLPEDAQHLPHILWLIHFVEIFDEDLKTYGFDICIANPPYLRSEEINKLFAQFDIKITKDDLVTTYEGLFANYNLKIVKKSDLYVCFFCEGFIC